MPSFRTAAEILTSISTMQWATQSVQANRAKINRLVNGDAPWTEEERRANRLNTNFNFLEGTRIATNARYQLHNAFFQPGNFFDIQLDSYDVPIWLREKWSACMTQYINRALRHSRQWRSVLEQAHAQVVLHGPGPSPWPNRHSPVPRTCGVDDVIVPAGTYADFSNLDCLAIYTELTWSQLYDMTHGTAVDTGWNRKYIEYLLAALYKQPLQPLFQGNRWLFPEKIAEDSKEQASWASAALPKLLCWNFFYRDEESGKWNRRMLLDYNNVQPEALKLELQRGLESRQTPPDFLFEKDDWADDVSEIVHFFLGNCSNVAPFRYYTVRSIGYLVYGVCYVQNMTRCRWTDHMLQNLLTLFRNVSEDDRERLENFELHHLGIFPDGISMVPSAERYAVNAQLVETFFAQNRQLMAESATSFLPDMATEGEKPDMTATEAMIRNNTSVTLTSSVLNQIYTQAEPLYREVVRRFSLGDERDPLVRQVLEDMEEDDIPRRVLKSLEHADVIVNRSMGGGNKAVQLTTAQALFNARPAFPPAAQIPILRKYVLALTDDARFAEEIVPDAPAAGPSTMAAQNAFGTLMQGVPVETVGTLNEPEYIQKLLELMGASTQQVAAIAEQPSGIPLATGRIAGLVNVGQHVEQHVAVLAQDKPSQGAARQFNSAVMGLMNELSGYGQQIAEMEQAQQPGGMSAADQAKVQAITATAEVKAQTNAALKHQQMQHKDAAFLKEQERKDAETQAEIQRKALLAHTDAAVKGIKTKADVAAKDLTTRADLIHGARAAVIERGEAALDTRQSLTHAQAEHEQSLAHTQQAHEQSLEHASQEHQQQLAAAKQQAAVAKKATVAKKPTTRK